MQPRCNPQVAAKYRSGAQSARAVTEAWAEQNLYCAGCDAPRLLATKANTPAHDFICGKCEQRYELKSMARWSDNRVVDSAYSEMIKAIQRDLTPNLLLLHYSQEWLVNRLVLIPRFFFSESIIEKRRPLAPTARRAGWVGCNIVIRDIPESGKIAMIAGGKCRPAHQVREQFSAVAPLANVPPSLRGWTLDVFRFVQKLPRRFSLQDIYRFEGELRTLHPGNQHVPDKIRQQLQVLRNAGLLRFVGKGVYEQV